MTILFFSRLSTAHVIYELNRGEATKVHFLHTWPPFCGRALKSRTDNRSSNPLRRAQQRLAPSRAPAQHKYGKRLTEGYAKGIKVRDTINVTFTETSCVLTALMIDIVPPAPV